MNRYVQTDRDKFINWLIDRQRERDRVQSCLQNTIQYQQHTSHNNKFTYVSSRGHQRQPFSCAYHLPVQKRYIYKQILKKIRCILKDKLTVTLTYKSQPARHNTASKWFCKTANFITGLEENNNHSDNKNNKDD